jgi:ferredoxin
MATLKIDDGSTLVANIGDSLLDISKKEKGSIPYSCDGVPACARCKVVISKGEEHLSPIGEKEENLIGNAYHVTKERLACQVKIVSEGEVEINNIPE